MTLTASAISGYQLSTGTSEHGQLKFMVNNAEVTTAQEGVVVTVVVTPDDNWSTKTVTAQAYAEWGDAQAPQHRAGVTILDDLTVSSTDNVNEWTMPATKVQVNAEYRKMLTHPTISIEDIASVTYTTQPLTPEVTVKDGEKVLTLNTDYTVSYTNNVNAGTATVTITGIGNYSGTATKNFNVVAAVYSTANAAIDVNVPEELGQLTPETNGQTTDLYYFLQSYLQNSPNPAYIRLRLASMGQYVISQPLTLRPLPPSTPQHSARTPSYGLTTTTRREC